MNELQTCVSVPYEITLLSNSQSPGSDLRSVSVPYEITLLSNFVVFFIPIALVSVPYEITLLSNIDKLRKIIIQFQYLMKLHYSQTD